ncbi:MAG: hypothetical protein D6702_11360 [Planctomycetota bacterium]|nr:MAG: hypothetical protein D6702_11360 [Planctomycetota bacterium]
MAPSFSSLACFTALLLSWACAEQPPTVLDKDATVFPEASAEAGSLSFDYRVGPGDVLRVTVFGHPELGSPLYRNSTPGTPVEASGKISMPLIGFIDVNGKTVFEIRDALVQAFSVYLKDPKVDVSVIQFGSQRFYVLGEVRQPGMFVLDRPLSLMQALSLSGGFTTSANREQVALVRGPIKEESVALVNFEDLDPAAALPVQSGDVIFVGRRRWAAVGEVARDLVPILQLIALPVGTARDIALFQDIRNN